MKALIPTIRCLGVIAAFFTLLIIGWSFSQSCMTLFYIHNEGMHNLAWKLALFDFLPPAIICLALLVPYSRIPTNWWILTYGFLCLCAIYFLSRSFIDAFQDTNMGLSLIVSAIPFSILLSQILVILADHPNKAEQGAAANP